MRYFACVVTILTCASSHAQISPARPQFEVASVKPAAEDEVSGHLPMMLRQVMRDTQQPGAIPMDDPGRVRLENWALLDLIAAAYRVRAAQVTGPSWLSDQGFDIEAKVPEGTQKEQLNGMLQSLLQERFGLKVHRDPQTVSGFALVVGKNGPKLKPAVSLPAPAPGLTDEEQQAKREQQAEERLAANRKRMQENRENGTPLEGFRRDNWDSITTEGLANLLDRFTEAPVVDQTGLTGKYSVSIETWKNPAVPGGTIFDAIEKLGLKLEPRKITVDKIVVDQVSKTPTAN
jgi:uncharacterized protein (TIGR03435 family)